MTDIEFCDTPDRREGVEFHSGILVPGMVNSHCHLELSYLEGAIPEGKGFVAFAEVLGAVRGVFAEGERPAAAVAADNAMWMSGTAAVADICNGETTFPAKARSNIFYHNFLELFGLNTASQEALAPVASAAAEAGLPWSVTPHATYSLGREAFLGAVEGLQGQTGGRDAPLSVHFMESAAEADFFSGTGEMAEWYARRGFSADFAVWGSPAGRIVAQVPPERDTMLIHNCFTTEEVVDMLEDHFDNGATWVLCPRSNKYLSGIEPPYNMLRRKGVRIAVGTDSLSTNWSLDLLEELKTFRGVPLEELLGWAVENGAEALGIQERLGGFEVGKRCGAVLLSGIDWGEMALTHASRAVRIV